MTRAKTDEVRRSGPVRSGSGLGSDRSGACWRRRSPRCRVGGWASWTGGGVRRRATVHPVGLRSRGRARKVSKTRPTGISRCRRRPTIERRRWGAASAVRATREWRRRRTRSWRERWVTCARRRWARRSRRPPRATTACTRQSRGARRSPSSVSRSTTRTATGPRRRRRGSAAWRWSRRRRRRGSWRCRRRPPHCSVPSPRRTTAAGRRRYGDRRHGAWRTAARRTGAEWRRVPRRPTASQTNPSTGVYPRTRQAARVYPTRAATCRVRWHTATAQRDSGKTSARQAGRWTRGARLAVSRWTSSASPTSCWASNSCRTPPRRRTIRAAPRRATRGASRPEGGGRGRRRVSRLVRPSAETTATRRPPVDATRQRVSTESPSNWLCRRKWRHRTDQSDVLWKRGTQSTVSLLKMYCVKYV